MAVQTLKLSEGRQATYEIVGKGRPALMLPGGPGFAAEYMRGDAELFSGVLQSYLIDPHGSGGSTPPPDPAEYSPEGHARFYEETRSALGLGRVVVFGHSFGSTTALTYSALFPDSVQACIAVAPFGVGTEQDRAEGGDAAAETEAMMAAVLPLYTAHPERPEVWAELEEFKTHMKSDLVAAKAWEGGLFQQIDLRPMLGQVQAPVLLVAGELDFICGPAQARPIAEALPSATLALIPDCGHIPSVESPDHYRAAVTDWLASRLD